MTDIDHAIEEVHKDINLLRRLERLMVKVEDTLLYDSKLMNNADAKKKLVEALMKKDHNLLETWLKEYGKDNALEALSLRALRRKAKAAGVMAYYQLTRGQLILALEKVVTRDHKASSNS